MGIKRFDICSPEKDQPMGYPSESGNFVLYEDHKKEIDKYKQKWQPSNTAPRKTEILLCFWDGINWNPETGWIEDWEPDFSPENLMWMPLPTLPERKQK